MIKLRRLLNETLQESVNDKNIFKAVFLAGGPGSGKGFILNNLIGGSSISPFGAKVVNSDTFFEFLLNKNNLPFEIDSSSDVYPKQMVQRARAKALASNQFFQIVNGCLPVFIDGTGSDPDKIKSTSNTLRSLGYDTSMVFVNTALETALKRNSMRQRKVPIQVVTQKWNEVQQNIGSLQTYFGNQNFLIVDNNVEYQTETQEYKDLVLQLFRQGKRLLESPIRNPIGKRLIKLMRHEGVAYISDLSLGQDLSRVVSRVKP
jgi:predicted kinase